MLDMRYLWGENDSHIQLLYFPSHDLVVVGEPHKEKRALTTPDGYIHVLGLSRCILDIHI